jgi:hypothetical protein
MWKNHGSPGFFLQMVGCCKVDTTTKQYFKGVVLFWVHHKASEKKLDTIQYHTD